MSDKCIVCKGYGVGVTDASVFDGECRSLTQCDACAGTGKAPEPMTPLEHAVDMVERGFSLQPNEAQVLLAAYRDALANAATWKELDAASDDASEANMRHVRINCGIMLGDIAEAWTEYQRALARYDAARKAVGK